MALLGKQVKVEGSNGGRGLFTVLAVRIDQAIQVGNGALVAFLKKSQGMQVQLG